MSFHRHGVKALILFAVGLSTTLNAQGIGSAWDGQQLAFFGDDDPAATTAIEEAVEAATDAIDEVTEVEQEAATSPDASVLQEKVADLESTIREYDEAFENIEKQMTELGKLAGLGEFDERITELEESEELGDLSDDLESLTEDFEEFSGDKTIVHSGSSASTMKVSGRIHIDYWGFPNNDPGIDLLEDNGGAGPQTRLGFRRMRFGVAGKLSSNMLYKIEMEFAGGIASEFRDAYFGWSDLPVLQKVLIGNQKRPYGLDHLNSSRYNVFLERPWVIESFNQDARRLGIQSYGVSDDEAWNWRYGVFNQQLIQALGNHINDDLQLEIAGRIANTFWYDEVSGGRGYGHWAVSHSYASPDGSNTFGTNEARFRHRPEARTLERWLNTGRIADASFYNLHGVEGVLNFGALQLVGEGQYVQMNRTVGSDLHFWGWYGYASYFLTGEHMPWKRSSGTLDRIKPFENFFLVDTLCNGSGGGWGAWQLAARYSYADFVSNDINGGIGESVTLGLNWYWTANARMQFNYIHGRVKNANEDLGLAVGGKYDILGARFMVDF